VSHALLIIGALVVICVIGVTALIKRQLANVKKIDFLQEYLKEFGLFASSYLESKEPSHKRYDWLVKNSDKAQAALGTAGVIQYQAPFGRFSSSHYELLVNTIPKFTDGMGPSQADLAMVDTALRRAIGIRQQRTETALKALKNPIKWLTSGVGTLLIMPLALLNELGIVSGDLVSRVRVSSIFKFITGSLSLIGILETAIGIILGKSFIVIAVTWIIERIGN
jgi:hypothetical protein